MKAIDLTGRKFGKLTVIEQAEHRNGKPTWKCICECGSTTTVIGDNLRNEHTKSCGCLKNVSYHITHGGSNSRLYPVWTSMLQRCNNKRNTNYRHYGGRGIKVCEEWLDFENFRDWAIKTGYDENAPTRKCTLDRIDVNSDYNPVNCRWVSQKEQGRNVRTNSAIEFNGVTRLLCEWSEITGISASLLWARINKLGWSIEDALTKPVKKVEVH